MMCIRSIRQSPVILNLKGNLFAVRTTGIQDEVSKFDWKFSWFGEKEHFFLLLSRKIGLMWQTFDEDSTMMLFS